MAQQSDKIGLKRLKRRRMLERRMRCHGNKDACVRDHARKSYKKVTSVRMDDLGKKTGILKRLFGNKKTS